MLVRLPREVSGKELLDVIKEAVKEIESDGYAISYLGITQRYEPGSLKQVIHSHSISIRKKIQTIKKKGFLGRKKEVVEDFGFPLFSFPELLSDKKYQELDIELIGGFVGFHAFPLYYIGERFEQVRPIFEKLLRGIYAELNPSSARA